MKLDYTAYDQTGQEVTATIEAPSASEATERLRHKGLYVCNITPVAAPVARSNASARPRRRSGKRLRQVASFMRHLHVLLSCSTPVVEALQAQERQATDDVWRDIIADIRHRVEEGATLSGAMALHPEAFDPVSCSLVEAGESSGDLPMMLQWLAEMSQKHLKVRNIITGALIYPMLLLVVTLAVLAVVLLMVVPRFGDLFKTLDMPLPTTTVALIALSDWLQVYWWTVPLSVAAMGVGLKLYLATPGGKRRWDRFVLGVPQLGRIIRNFTTARIGRLLGGLMQGHVPVLEALQLTKRSLQNTRYVDLIERAREAVGEGESLSSAFRDTDLISPSVYEAMHNGEQNGQIAPLLLNLADFMDDDNEVVMRSLTSIVEPVILLVMGLLVATVAVGMFMPLFDLTAMTQGGM
jgi:type II secretory pathway component PulF